jgi:hypothetical protein
MNLHIFTAMMTIAQVLDSADELGVEERASLLAHGRAVWVTTSASSFNL